MSLLSSLPGASVVHTRPRLLRPVAGNEDQIPIPYPPPAEQDAVVAQIEGATSEVDAAIAKAEREIQLMNEYRTVPILDVVTRKIDVRGAASLPEEDEE